MRATQPLLRSARTTIRHQVSYRLAFLVMAVFGAMLLFVSAARAQSPISFVTLATDQSPLTLSNNFGVPLGSVVNQAGDYAFIGEGGSALFLRRSGASSATRLLQFGDPVPNITGGTVVDFANLGGLNSSAHLLFAVDYNVSPPDGQLHRAILLYNGTAYITIATSDQVAPGTGGQTFGPNVLFAGEAPTGGALNDNDDVLIETTLEPFASTETVPNQNTYYIAPAAGTPVRLLGQGDSILGGTLVTFSGTASPLNALGQFLINAEVLTTSSGTISSLLIVAKSGLVTKVVGNGDAKPSPATGTFTINPTTTFALNNSGQAAFVDPGTPASLIEPGIWFYSSGVITNIFTGPLPNESGTTTVQLSALSDLGEAVALVNPGSGPTIYRVHSSNDQVDTVASTGEAAPGGNGATFSSFSNLSTDNTDRVTFFAVSSTGGEGIYQQTGTATPQVVVLEGQSAPSPVGGTFNLLTSTIKAVNNGSTFFSASISSGAGNYGQFIGTPGSLAELMSTADTLPAGARVRLSNPAWSNGANNSNGLFLGFDANLTGGQSALFIKNIATGVATRIVGEGDAIPGFNGATFIQRATSTGSKPYYMNDNGQVTFPGLLTGGAAAIFIGQPTGGVTALAETGEGVPAIGGSATFTSFEFSSSTNSLSPINDSGQVAFYGTVSNGKTGILSASISGGLTLIASTGETVPEGGATFTLFTGCTTCGLAINSSGEVAFGANKSTGSGIYTNVPDGTPLKVAASTDENPQETGLFGVLDPVSGFNDSGQVVFEAVAGGGVYTETGGAPATAVVLDGTTNPGAGGGALATSTLGYSTGTFSSFFATANTSIDDCGDVAFQSRVTGGTANSGYFGIINSACSTGGFSPGPLQALALQGQAVAGAGTLGPIFSSSLTSSFFSLDEGNVGVFSFTNSFTNTSGATMIGQFLATTSGAVQTVMAPGTPILGTGGGTYASATATANPVNSGGALIYDVLTNGGTASQAIVLAVQQTGTVATTTTLVSSQNPSGFGEPVTFTATVTSTDGTPAVGDIVGFADNGVAVGLGNLDANGQATFTTSSLTPGTHSITAEFFSNSCNECNNENFESSTSAPLTQSVSNATTTELFSLTNPSLPGQSVEFEAIVFASLGSTIAPTGTVNFFDGATQIGSGTLNDEVVIFTTSSLATGTHVITAQYLGDSNFAGDTSNVVDQSVETTTLPPSSTALASSLNPSIQGESVTFTAVVDGSGGGTPTGTVTFYDGSTQIGTGSLNTSSGVTSATFTTSSLAAGSQSITAAYLGDSNFSPSTSNAVIQVVAASAPPPATVTTVSSSLNPAGAGQSVTFTATVTSTNGAVPTGTVTFFDGATSIGTGTLNAAGVATLTDLSLAVGSHSITAQYAGNISFGASTSDSIAQMVNTAPAVLGGGPAGLNARAIAVDPQNPSTVYAGARGIFKSTNGGATWTEMPDTGLTTLPIQLLAIDPTSTPSTVYAGTIAGGVFKSVDGGVTWTAAYSGLPGGRTSVTAAPTQANGTSGTDILSMAVDPTTSPATIYAVVATTVTGLSGNLGRIYKSTNGATTWVSVNTGLEGCTLFPPGYCTASISVPGLVDTFVESLTIDPLNPQTLYAGTVPGGMFKTTNGGTSWSSVNSSISTSNTDIEYVAADPQNEGTVYAVAADNTSRIVPTTAPPTGATKVIEGTNSGVYKSTNGGSTWALVDTGLPILTISALPANTIIVQSLAINPANSSTLYAGVVENHYADVFISTNGGASWAAENSGIVAQTLTVNPSTTSTIYAGSTGGIFESINSGTTWTEVSAGIPAVGVNTVVVDPNNSSNVYAATNNGLFKSSNGGATSWAPLTFAPGFSTAAWSVAVDPNSSSTIYTAYSDVNGVYKSTNGGLTWTQSTSGISPAIGSIVESIVVDPNNSSVVYAGSQDDGIFKSTDGGNTWSVVNSATGQGFGLESLVIDPANSSTLYAAALTTGVLMSTNGGATWTAVNSGITSTSTSAFALAIVPSNPTTLYASVVGGTGGVSVFETTNGGTSWTASSSGIPNNLEITSLAVNPANPLIVFAAASGSGVYKSTNGGGSWTASNSGLTSLSVDSLAIDPSNPNTVYAGIGNAGVFKSTDGGTTWQPTAIANLAPTSTSVLASPNPSTSGQSIALTATVTSTGGTGTPTGTVSFYDGTTFIGPGTLNASAQATFLTSSLAIGTHSITAQYSGDTNFAASTSSAVMQTVQAPTNLLPSATALASSMTTTYAGESVTFTAVVDGQSGGTPTGSVNFLDGSTVIGTGPLTTGTNGTQVATFVISSLLAGTHSITATYLGSASFSPSTSNIVTQSVTSAFPVSIVVTPANPSIPLGTTQQFTATATLTDTTMMNVTSSVTWNSTNGYAATINATGLASSAGLSQGQTTISATLGTISSSTTLTVTAPALVSIAVTPATASVVVGNTQPYAAMGTYTDGSLLDVSPLVTWHSSATSVATINGVGVATGVESDEQTGITAQSGSVTSNSATLNVTAASLVSIAVTPLNPTTAQETNEQFTAIGTYSDSSVADLTSKVTWSSTAQNVATIGASGIASTAEAATGSTTISAKLGSVNGNSTTLTVTTAQPQPQAYHLDFYGNSGLQTGVLGNLINNYSTISNGTFQVASSALGTPNNLYLYRDPAFLSFDAPFSTNFNNYDFNLGNTGTIYFPGDAYPFGDGTNTDPVQGLRLDSSGNPLRFETPSTSSGTSSVIRDFVNSNTPSAELTMVSSDSFAYVELSDGTLLPTSSLDGQSPYATVGGTWTFNGGPGDGTLYSGVYLITPVEAITSANSVNFMVGSQGSFTLKTVGSPLFPSQLSQLGALPNGVSFTDNGDGTGTLSGVPAVGSAATYQITFAATNNYCNDSECNPDVDPDVTQTFTLTVSASALTATNTALTSSTNPSPFGQNITFTATVTDSAEVTPTGSVNFIDNTADTTLGTVTLTGGVATFSTSSLTVGSHVVTAQYTGDGLNFAASPSSNPVTEVIQPVLNPSDTILTSSLNPAAYGQSVVLTAVVYGPGGGTPTGTVTFMNNSQPLGSAVPLVTTAGQTTATFTVSLLPLGSNSIVAVYSGDSNFNTSTSVTVLQTINHGPTATAVASSLNPSAGGQTVQFSAIVTSPTGETPTGTVTFLDGGVSIGTGNLNASGVATFITTTLAVGAHSITAQYPNGLIFNGSTSAPLTQTVTLNPTATSLISSLNPSPSTDFVQFSAIVTSSAGVTPVGTVNFLDNTNDVQLGSSVLNANGVATYGSSTLSIGNHSITAQYLGNSSFGGSTSSAVVQSVTINPTPTTAPTFVAIASSPNPSAVGQAVTITATVSSSTSGTPTGRVTFLDNGTPLTGGVIQLATGSTIATFSTSSLAAGSHPLTAQYSGDANFALSLSPVLSQTVGSGNSQVSVQITPIPTNVAPQTSCPSGGYCQQFNASVQNGGSSPVVTWQVLSGPGSVDSTGNYTALPSVTQGPVTISATVGNSSASVSFTLGPDALTTSQTPATVAAGTPLSIPVQLAGVPASSTVPFTLSCGSLPAATTCQFTNPTNTAPNAANCPTGTITFVTGACPNFTVMVITSGGTSSNLLPSLGEHGKPSWPGGPWYGLCAAVLSALALMGRRRGVFFGRRSYACCVLALLCLSVVFLASCSVFPATTTVTAPAAVPLTPSGSYQVVVLATPPSANNSGFVQTQLIVPVVVN